MVGNGEVERAEGARFDHADGARGLGSLAGARGVCRRFERVGPLSASAVSRSHPPRAAPVAPPGHAHGADPASRANRLTLPASVPRRALRQLSRAVPLADRSHAERRSLASCRMPTTPRPSPLVPRRELAENVRYAVGFGLQRPRIALPHTAFLAISAIRSENRPHFS